MAFSTYGVELESNLVCCVVGCTSNVLPSLSTFVTYPIFEFDPHVAFVPATKVANCAESAALRVTSADCPAFAGDEFWLVTETLIVEDFAVMDRVVLVGVAVDLAEAIAVVDLVADYLDLAYLEIKLQYFFGFRQISAMRRS